MLGVLLSLLLALDTCHWCAGAGAPLMDLAAAPSPRHPVQDPVLNVYMKHVWQQQQQQGSLAPHPLSHVIGIRPHAVRWGSSPGSSHVVFRDLDLAGAYDAAHLLFHGSCPHHARVRVCRDATCTHRRAQLTEETPYYYVTALPDVTRKEEEEAGAGGSAQHVPRLDVTVTFREASRVYGCDVTAVLLIQYAAAIPAAPVLSLPSRVRRSPSSPDLCRMEQWSTSVAEIGIDSILYPSTLQVNQCVGRCSLDVAMYSNHAFVRHRYNLHAARTNSSARVAEPCCVPIKMNPLSLLQFNDQSNMVVKVYHDMQVEACGCI